MDLLTIFKILFKRKLILMGVPFVALVAAFFFTADYKRTYKSTAQLSTGFTISPEVQVTAERFNLYEVNVKFNNLTETINSARVISLLSYRLLLHDLDDDKKEFRNFQDNKEKAATLAGIDRDAIKRAVRGKLDSMKLLDGYSERDRQVQEVLNLYKYDYESLKKTLTVSRIKSTDYVSVVAFTENPYLSAFIANTLCDEFLRFNSSLITARSDESVQTFAKLVRQKKEELDLKAEELRRFKSSNSLLNLSAESENKISQISDLEFQQRQEDKNIRSIKLQLRDINSRLSQSGSDDPVNNNNQINSEIINIKKRISLLNQRYVASGSTDKQALDSINILRNQQRRLINSVSQVTTSSQEDTQELIKNKNKYEVDLQIAEQNLIAIKTTLDRLKRNVGGYASKEAQIAAFEREVALAGEEYKNAQEKYNQSLDVSLASGNPITQVLFGQPASEPEPSKRVIITGLVGASTFVLCVIIIILLEYIDVSIKSSANFRKNINLRLIGSLNHINLKKNKVIDLFDANRGKLDKKGSMFRESLRKLRFFIENQEKSVFLVTSTKSGEGKSLLINALSLALSFSKSSVLIIDINFSNNSLTQHFNASSSLEKTLTQEQVDLKKTVSKTQIEGVDILGCQEGNYSPMEIFSAKKFKCLLTEMAKRYDYVFIEGASLNTYSDSRELSEFVDGVIAVFSAKSTVKQPDLESIEFLKELGDKNFGAVLNDIETENMES